MNVEKFHEVSSKIIKIKKKEKKKITSPLLLFSVYIFAVDVVGVAVDGTDCFEGVCVRVNLSKSQCLNGTFNTLT